MEIGKLRDQPAFPFILWIGAWVAFFTIHGFLMAIDWRLRDHTSDRHPLPGGVPDPIHGFAVWGSVILLGITLYYLMPRSWATWIRASLTIVQAIAAVLIVLFSSLMYVLLNGIDTL